MVPSFRSMKERTARPVGIGGRILSSQLLFVLLVVLVATPWPLGTSGRMVRQKRQVTADQLGFPTAITLFWFNNVEVGICYDLRNRVDSVSGKIHCNAQDGYDENNNTYELPQTCVALVPKEEPLLIAIKAACTSAGGTYGHMEPNDEAADRATDLSEGRHSSKSDDAVGQV